MNANIGIYAHIIGIKAQIGINAYKGIYAYMGINALIWAYMPI